MAQLRKMLLTVSILILLSLSGCGNMYLTSPYTMNGNVQLFLDGKMVASGNFDLPFTSNTGDYVYRIESGSNPVDAMAQLFVFARGIGWEEIKYLYDNFGMEPYYPADVSGHYTFSGDLLGGPIIGVGVGYDATLISGAVPSFPVVDNSVVPAIQALAPAGNSVIQLGDYVIPETLNELSVNFWYQEGLDTSTPVSLLHIFNPNSSFDPDIELYIEPGGNIVLTVGTNWSKIWYHPGPGFDDADGHMITVRLRN